MDEFLAEDLGMMRGEAWSAEVRPLCAYFRGIGTCSFGCWEEPSCTVAEPAGGWQAEAYERWMDVADTARAAAVESRGDHRAVKELRDTARHAERRAVRLLIAEEA